MNVPYILSEIKLKVQIIVILRPKQLKYSQRPKSEHIRFSDVQLLDQFQTLIELNVLNPNNLVQILEEKKHLKAQRLK